MAGTIAISAPNSPPKEKELRTAKFFSERGKDITFIPPSNIPGHRRPDFNMDGLEWEVKCPDGSSKRTIERCIVSAEGQSLYIIWNLRYVKLPEKFCLSQVEINFNTRSRVKRILVITKTLQLIEFPPK